MIDAKEAALKAKSYLTELLETQPGSLRIEEVDREDGGDTWVITLSFLVHEPTTLLGSGFLDPTSRTYKVFRLDKASGTVMSMKIRPKDTGPDAQR